jgi:hypothetical protein
MAASLRRFILSDHAFPPAEQVAVKHAEIQLNLLTMYVRRFEAALHLYKHADNELNKVLLEIEQSHDIWERASRVSAMMMSTIREWREIPVRDAALSVFHFYMTLDAVSFKQSETLRKYVDRRIIRTAKGLFKSKFPHCESIRDALSHSGEAFQTPEKIIGHAYFGEIDTPGFKWAGGGPKFVPGQLQDDKLFWTWKGEGAENSELIWIECSQKTLNDLISVRDLVFQAFFPVLNFVRQVLQEQGAKSDHATATPLEQD